MKKTFLVMLLAGGTMTMFAQTTPATGNQTEPTTGTPNTTQQSTDLTNTQMNNMNTMDTTTPGATINMRNGTRTNSTSWAPDSQPSTGWNSYGVWNSDANWNSNPNNPYRNNTGANGAANMNTGNSNMNNQNNMNAEGTMNSTGAYSAYGTAVPYLPANVQMRFNQDFPMNVNTTYSWHQYGDWFHTSLMNNGRTTQYFYDTRGNGYSLALPVLLSYVPENIVTNALNKYGNNLYSISMVKTNDGNDTYIIGLLDRGQLSTHYLNESGATVNDVWRTEDYGTMQSTQSNAAMGDSSSMDNQNMNHQNMDHGNMNHNNMNQSKQSAWDAKKEDKKMNDDKKNENEMR